MKNKIKFLTKQSLNKKIKTRWFKVVNVVLLCLLVFLCNIDRIVTLFGGDFEEVITVYVDDEINEFELFSSVFENLSSTMNSAQKYAIEEKKYTEEIKEELKDNQNLIVLRMMNDSEHFVKAQMISYNEVSLVTNQLLRSSLNSVKEAIAISKSGLTVDEIRKITEPIDVDVLLTNEDVEANQNKEFVAAGVSLVIILPCFFLILMLVQMIGAEINDEKTTRSMEIIISNVSPKAHFISKVLSSTLFVLLQGVLMLLYGAIALFSRSLFSSQALPTDTLSSLTGILEVVKNSGMIDLLIQGLPFLLILFVSSFVLYAIVAGVLASMTTSLEDFQQLQTPIMLVIMAGYYLALLSTQFEGALFIKLAAFLPMISFLLSPVLFFLGQFSLIELGISTLITIGFTWVVFHYGLRIYKVGILNYSSQKLWRKMLTSIKKKD